MWMEGLKLQVPANFSYKNKRQKRIKFVHLKLYKRISFKSNVDRLVFCYPFEARMYTPEPSKLKCFCKKCEDNSKI